MKERKIFLPINVDIMTGRNLKMSYLDKRMHIISDDFHKGHLYSRFGEKNKKQLPY